MAAVLMPWQTAFTDPLASFGKPIGGKTADRLGAVMLDSAREYNADSSKPLFLERLRIFGSYLDTSLDPLGDVDVCALPHWFPR